MTGNVEAAQLPWLPIGELFVQKGLISAEQLETALAEQAATGTRLGEILVKHNLISSPELTQALMEQLGREVAKEDGFGTGLWAEIRRRNANPDAEWAAAPASAPAQPARGPFGDGLARKLTVASDENGHEPTAVDETEFEELRQSLAESSSEGMSELEGDGLQKALQDARMEIEVLERVVADRERSLTALESEISSLRERPETRDDTGAGEVEALLSELEAAKAELRVRGARVGELEATLTNRDSQIAELQQLAGTEQSDEPDTASLHQDLDAARTRVTGLEAALSERTDELGRLEATLADAHREQDELRLLIEDADRRDGEARQAMSGMERGLETLRSELVAVRTELSGREQESDALSERLAAAEAAVTAERARSEAELDEMRHARDDQAEHAGTLERELASSRKAEAQLQEQLATAQTWEKELSALREQLAAAEAAHAEETSRSRQAYDGVRRKCREHKERARALEQELSSKRATEAELHVQLAAARASEDELTELRDQLAGERRRFQQELDQLGRERDSEADRRTALEQELASRLETEAQLEGRLAAVEARAGELDDRSSRLSEQLAASESELRVEREAQARNREAAEEATTRLREAESRVADLESALEQIADEKEELTRAFCDERATREDEITRLGAQLAEASAAHSETRNVLSQALAELSAREPHHGVDRERNGDQQAYVCFTNSPAGYRLVPNFGSLPALGAVHELDGVAHTVLRIGHSPLPFDSRPCVYLIAAPTRAAVPEATPAD